MQQPCLDAGRKSWLPLGDPEAATIRAKVVIVITTAEEERDQATATWIDVVARACVLPGGIFEHIYLIKRDIVPYAPRVQYRPTIRANGYPRRSRMTKEIRRWARRHGHPTIL